MVLQLCAECKDYQVKYLQSSRLI